jgi:hypothetical protein
VIRHAHNAGNFLEQHFRQRHYDLERVGRYKLISELFYPLATGSHRNRYQVGYCLPGSPHDYDQ